MRARARLWTKPCRMPISARLDFRPWSRVDSITNRTAVYGPVRTVVWEGRRSDPPPYPDQECLGTTRGQTRVSTRPKSRALGHSGQSQALHIFEQGHEIDFHLLVAAEHDHILEDTGCSLPGHTRQLETVAVKVDGMDVVA